MSVTKEEHLDLRCPLGPRALLGKLRKEKDFESIQMLREYGTIQLSCRDCTKMVRKDDSTVKRVVHEYNVFGELVESRIQRD